MLRHLILTRLANIATLTHQNVMLEEWNESGDREIEKKNDRGGERHIHRERGGRGEWKERKLGVLGLKLKDKIDCYQ